MRIYVPIGLVVALTAACRGDSSLDALFAGDLEVLDLTHALSADMVYWPNPSGNPFRHDTLRAHPNGQPAMAAYQTPEHHGTHLDAPVHGGEGQPSVDELEPHDLFGPAVVIDVTQQATSDPDYLLSLGDVAEWEAEHGRIPDGAIVLLSTGWSRKWDDHDAYRNQDDTGTMHFPGYSPEVAAFLVRDRAIRGIGIDALSVDHGPSSDFPVHRIVNGSGKFHLENVANVHELPPTGTHLIVAPIKIAGGSGGQVRLFAVLP